MFSMLIGFSLLIPAGCSTAQENHICPVHKSEMEMKRVAFTWDMPDKAGMKYDKIRKKRFPNCDDPYYAGDLARLNDYDERYICEQCNIARDNRVKQNQDKKGS